jgi:hypothetical protein
MTATVGRIDRLRPSILNKAFAGMRSHRNRQSPRRQHPDELGETV